MYRSWDRPFFVIILFVSKGGKGALKELSLAGASGGTFDTLLGPFAAVLSQIMVFIQKLVIVVYRFGSDDYQV